MLPKTISAWRFADGHSVVDVAPMVRRDLDRLDAARLNGVDELEHALHLRPAVDAQEDVRSGRDGRHRLARRSRLNSAQDVEAREHCPVLIRGPSDQRKDASGREEEDASAPVEDLFA